MASPYSRAKAVLTLLFIWLALGKPPDLFPAFKS